MPEYYSQRNHTFRTPRLTFLSGWFAPNLAVWIESPVFSVIKYVATIIFSPLMNFRLTRKHRKKRKQIARDIARDDAYLDRVKYVDKKKGFCRYFSHDATDQSVDDVISPVRLIPTLSLPLLASRSFTYDPGRQPYSGYFSRYDVSSRIRGSDNKNKGVRR